MSAPLPKAALLNPFLLPVCECAGPTNLVSLEPHPTDPKKELKTYKCASCGRQQVLAVVRRG